MIQKKDVRIKKSEGTVCVRRYVNDTSSVTDPVSLGTDLDPTSKSTLDLDPYITYSNTCTVHKV